MTPAELVAKYRTATSEELVAILVNRMSGGWEPAGMEGTPRRVVESWWELFSGYRVAKSELLKQFDEPCDELVLVKDIDFFSTCKHHLLPFFGKAHVAYIPAGGKVYGLSKLPRLVEACSRKLQTQEAICDEVATALSHGPTDTSYTTVLGAACVIEATHLCMCARGVNKPGAKTVTSKLVGAFRDDPRARSELLQLIFGGK